MTAETRTTSKFADMMPYAQFEVPDISAEEATYILAKLEADPNTPSKVRDALTVQRTLLYRRSMHLSHALGDLDELQAEVKRMVKFYDEAEAQEAHSFEYDSFNYGPTAQQYIEAWQGDTASIAAE